MSEILMAAGTVSNPQEIGERLRSSRSCEAVFVCDARAVASEAP